MRRLRAAHPVIVSAIVAFCPLALGSVLPPSAAAATRAADPAPVTSGAGATDVTAPTDGTGPAVPSSAEVPNADSAGPTDGTVEAPATPVRATVHVLTGAAVPSAVTAANPPLPFAFKTSSYSERTVPDDELPYNGTLAPRTDPGVHDSQGVRMFNKGGFYNHPVAQAQWGLANLATYRINKDTFFLDRAAAQAQRLIDTRTVVGSAWFIPYPFDFALHGGAGFTEKAPWYSGMAQGQALSLFSRLVKADPTNAEKWLSAAQAVYNSFLVAPSSSSPWVVHPDSSGYLWLDEYPIAAKPGVADLTFNGHNFAIFGLYDYYELTQDPQALQLLDGAQTMSHHYVSSFRDSSWLSRYCLDHPSVRSVHYHIIHTMQLTSLYSMTGDIRFVAEADAFRGDYPNNVVRGSVVFSRGTHTGYKFDAATGRVVGQKSMSIAHVSTASGSNRRRVIGRGIYLLINTGSLAGYSVPEDYTRAWMRGVLATLTYDPARQLHFKGGSYTAYTFNSAGSVTGHVTKSVAANTSATFDRSSVMSGRLFLHVVSGSFNGYWMLRSVVTVD